MKWVKSFFYVGHALAEYAYFLEYWAATAESELRSEAIGIGALNRAKTFAVMEPSPETGARLLHLTARFEVGGRKLARSVKRFRALAFREAEQCDTARSSEGRGGSARSATRLAKMEVIRARREILRTLRKASSQMTTPEQSAFRLGVAIALEHSPSRSVTREFRRLVPETPGTVWDSSTRRKSLLVQELARCGVPPKTQEVTVGQLRSLLSDHRGDFLSYLADVSNRIASAVRSIPEEEGILSVYKNAQAIVSSEGPSWDFSRTPAIWKTLALFLRDPERSAANLAFAITPEPSEKTYKLVRTRISRLKAELRRAFGSRLRLESRAPGYVLETSMKIVFV